MAPPLARTHEETYLYFELHPCPCGEVDFGSTSSLELVDDEWIVRYTGQCVACGRPRGFEFRQPDEPTAPDDGEWAPGREPSQLLDAGEWLWVADVYGSVPAELDGLSDAEREQARTDLLAARAAIDEVLKFLPARAAEVPQDAFWSYRGRVVRTAEPGRFGRVRLEAARAAYDRALAEFDR
ncbi:hypothetical protein ACGFIR_14365 [Micromonospora sp. NPDC049051]|uniref:hypothetical protein n=1 Tax=Micromonospora sp. NPDC049051 TaxID=3364264 RepID=UPI00371FF6AF